jgi:TolB protein
MARASLETSSAQVNAVVHGDGLTSLQFRRTDRTNIEEAKFDLKGADVIQLERHGNRYTMSAAGFGERFVMREVDDLKLGDEVEVGLFVCAHSTNVLENGVFEDVRLTIPAHEGLVQYREYLGSRLEVLDIETGRRQVVFRTADGIEAPNWTTDGAALIYNSQGKLFHFGLSEKTPVLLDTGFATRCNNDHVLSFDGQILGISNSDKATGDKSAVYTLPAAGGRPRLITTNGTSYLHGFSPDGKFLIFTGERGGEFDIYRIPVAGGVETRLTTNIGLDDGSEYTPDGNYIYFNSSRTGSMQLWRMKPDGSAPEQMTQDEFNNWFPHVSRDGRRIVFLSFTKDVPAEKHPYYERVYLREMPTAGGQPRVVAYLYGGQGTINVPSWNPDNRHLAFVSHTGAVK